MESKPGSEKIVREIRRKMRRKFSSEEKMKIERYHLALKNVVLLQNYYQPGELEREIDRFVQYYNHEREATDLSTALRDRLLPHRPWDKSLSIDLVAQLCRY